MDLNKRKTREIATFNKIKNEIENNIKLKNIKIEKLSKFNINFKYIIPIVLFLSSSSLIMINDGKIIAFIINLLLKLAIPEGLKSFISYSFLPLISVSNIFIQLQISKIINNKIITPLINKKINKIKFEISKLNNELNNKRKNFKETIEKLNIKIKKNNVMNDDKFYDFQEDEISNLNYIPNNNEKRLSLTLKKEHH